MDGSERKDVGPGLTVAIVLKQEYPTFRVMFIASTPRVERRDVSEPRLDIQRAGEKIRGWVNTHPPARAARVRIFLGRSLVVWLAS